MTAAAQRNAPYNNQQLFSDYYLDAKLPVRDAWRALAAESAPVRTRLAEVFARYTPNANEAQVEHDWIRPVLEALGHAFAVQAPLKTPDGTKRPDYILYPDGATRDALANASPLTDDMLRRAGAIAVADAKAWDRPLDVALAKKGGDPFDNRNPSYQIAFYVQHAGLEWGILTNGRLWRLYHRDSAYRLNRYYEVDLPALLERDGDDLAFLSFYGFFRRAAFDPASPVGLDALLKDSVEFARGVGDSLKVQVYTALRHLAQGFLDYRPNGLDAADPATRAAIYDSALILLYRLLFVLYAEARGLLPVQQPAYRDGYSLLAMKRRVADDLDAGRTASPSVAMRWPVLKELFRVINEGDEPLKVTTYNGGLFDPARHEFLDRNAVGDYHLMRALDLLTRADDPALPRGASRVFVDYRDLSERHLGTIYEGLLEYRLVPLAAPEGGWTVALENDKGERKATGSYYTPDYIVKYLVDRTVGPALREAVAGKATDAEKIAAVLSVNVLDPAMGSGHFLVEATEYIARFLVDLGVVESHAGGAAALEPRFACDVSAWPAASRLSEPGEETAPEADIDYWKRRVVHSCIYGVDLNPLAVDLAKLSLWLSTLAADRPLSFLDHHLRPGNALVGAALADLTPHEDARAKQRRAKAANRAARQEAAGQITMMADDAFRQSMSLAVGNMWLIEASEAASVAEVKEQERLYAALREAFTGKYGRLADLVCAVRFGLTIDIMLWQHLSDYAMGRLLSAPPKFAEWLREAEALATDPGRRFFHWELEFPELYFDAQGRSLGDAAGFDAVIGNPPYIRQERLAPLKPFLSVAFADVFHSVADLYVYFFAQGLRQLRRGGRMGYVCSNSWLQTGFAEALRRYVRTAATVETLVDLGNNRTFAEAPDVCPTVFVFRNEQPPAEHRFTSVVFQRGEPPMLEEDVLRPKTVSVRQNDQSDLGWHLENDEIRGLFSKLLSTGEPLGRRHDGQLLYGLKTGLNEAFIIDTATRNRIVAFDPASTERIKPIVRGEDLRPWYQEDEGRWLVLFPSGWTQAEFGPDLAEADAWNRVKSTYPALAAWLEPFTDAARKRGDKGDYWWELRACAYYEAFERSKVFWPDIAKIPRFSAADAGEHLTNTGYMIASDDLFLLAVLQSRTTWALISRLALHNKFREGLWEYRLFPQYLSRLPIPDAPEPERAALGGLAQETTALARERYALHQRVRRRLHADLGDPTIPLNQQLTAWWDIPDFPTLRAALRKLFKREIPVAERDEWEAWFVAQGTEHRRLTQAIIQREGEINERVYALFALTADERRLIEESTKYPYGAV